jgi:hypothetical protein
MGKFFGPLRTTPDGALRRCAHLRPGLASLRKAHSHAARFPLNAGVISQLRGESRHG